MKLGSKVPLCDVLTFVDTPGDVSIMFVYNNKICGVIVA